jgi:hypothetical protein
MWHFCIIITHERLVFNFMVYDLTKLDPHLLTHPNFKDKTDMDKFCIFGLVKNESIPSSQPNSLQQPVVFLFLFFNK